MFCLKILDLIYMEKNVIDGARKEINTVVFQFLQYI